MDMAEFRTQYERKMVLAPMVRIGTTPFRVLALDYGADLVYSEEIIDHRLIRSRRVPNLALGTVDFIEQDDSLVLRVAERERSRLVVQLGTSDAARALEAARKVEKDVCGIDVNMGCPKAFSIKGGMGAALLNQPQKVETILRMLSKHLSIPVTCKIRILPSLEKTLELVNVIEATGVAALAVHGRTKEERPNHANHVDFIKAVVEKCSIPVLANGGSSNNRRANSHESVLAFWKETGASSVMVARAAEWNPSIFRPGTPDDLWKVAEKYMKLAIEFDCQYTVSKYTLQQIIGSEQTESEKGRAVLAASTLRDLSIVFDMEKQYEAVQNRLREQISASGGVWGASKFSRENVEPSPPLKKSRVLDDKEANNNEDAKEVLGENEVSMLFCPFVRGHYKTPESIPKNRLLSWTRKKGLKQPRFVTVQTEKTFRSVVEVNGAKFGSSSKEKNKKFAEQAAALAAIQLLKIGNEKAKNEKTDVMCDSNNANVTVSNTVAAS